MKIFSKWVLNEIIDQDHNKPHLNPSMTASYNPNLNTTASYHANNNSASTQQPNADPEMQQHTQDLKDIHTKLHDVFDKVRRKIYGFHYPKMRDAFERELINGIDHIGRAHAIIRPSALGIEKE